MLLLKRRQTKQRPLKKSVLPVRADSTEYTKELLNQDPVPLDWFAMKTAINNKVILVTGAAGSIGAEICRQIAKLRPKILIALDYAESNLSALQQEMQTTFPIIQVHYHLINIQDKCAIMQVLQTYKPELMFHAAAYKDIMLLQTEIREAVQNNVLGTYNLALAAVQHQVKNFILVSTDEAAKPQNIMSATKRIAEIICHSLNQQQSTTKFTTVRFGDLQDTLHFFMFLQNAAQLILQALAISYGGETFVLDLDKPIDITLLALTQTSNRKILQIPPQECQYQWQKLVTFLEQIEVCCQIYNINSLQAFINELVPEYNTTTSTNYIPVIETPDLTPDLNPA